jgi:hypothetical protein
MDLILHFTLSNSLSLKVVKPSKSLKNCWQFIALVRRSGDRFFKRVVDVALIITTGKKRTGQNF